MTETASTKSEAIWFGQATPILRVESLEVSRDYYVKVLGFKVDWGDASMISVSRGSASLMLCEGHQGNPGTWAWIGVGDADALFQEYSATGATVRLRPTNYPWAYEFHVEDPDRHVLRFGSDPKDDQPFSEWVLWYATLE